MARSELGNNLGFFVGKNVTCKADVKTDGIVHIEGKFTGSISGQCDCVIAKDSSVRCKLSVKNLVVAGQYSGVAKISSKAVLLSGSEFQGTLTADTCDVEHNSVINGSLNIAPTQNIQ